MDLRSIALWGYMAKLSRGLRLAPLLVPLLLGQKGQDPGTPLFYRDARGDLAFAMARGDTIVTLAIAARPGLNAAVAEAVASAGGTVGYRADDVGYLRVKVRIDRLPTLLRSAAIEAVTVDMSSNTRPFSLWNGVDSTGPRSPWPGIDTVRQRRLPPDDALRRPYSPLADMDALAMRQRHPSYDGRGVVIAHVEGHIDVLAPEFQTAYAIDGRRIPKIADYLTADDPEAPPDPDPSAFKPWVNLDSAVTATQDTFSVGGKLYRAPRAGSFRFGTFISWRLCGFLARREFSSLASDTAARANRACGYAVLFDPASKEVWVDSNQNLSFADEKSMRDYRVRNDLGVFGVDDPKTTDGREAFGFAVQTHPSGKYVAILVGFGGHATLVAGSVVGNRVPNGLYDGVAPGAQILEIGYRATASNVTEALIMAFRDPRVDVVLYEQNVFVANGYRLGDGRFVPTIITSRLIEKYRKPYCVPGDNDMGVGITSEHGNARFGFAVGAYESKDAYRINVGVRVKEHDNQHIVGASGPNGLGAIKPDLMAPSGILTSEIAMKSYLPKSGVKGLFSLPAGYGIGGGTSQATPVMAGALSIVIGAAKQEKVTYDAERLWWAMTNGARFIKHLPAHTQGNGLVQVGAAFALLKSYAAKRPDLGITSSAPVVGPMSAELVEPNRGTGLYERLGWDVGMRAPRTISFRRDRGPREPMTFAIATEGNDGTFELPQTITLPLGAPVAVEVMVAPKKAGAHSTLITLDHPDMPGHAYRTMATVIAADKFEAKDDYTLVKKDSMARPGPWGSYFVQVPAGTAALTVDLEAPDELKVMVHDPMGREEQYTPDVVKYPRSRTIQNPAPGIWEVGFWLRNDGLELRWQDPDALIDPPLPYTLRMKIFGADLAATAGQNPPGPRSFGISAVNRLASAEAAVATMAIGSARTINGRLTRESMAVHEIQVPQGTSYIELDVTGAPDADLYLFDCSGKECIPSMTVATPGAPHVIGRESPTAGKWKLVLDGLASSSGEAQYSIREVIFEPTLGTLGAADRFVRRGSGARWSVPANVWIAGTMTSGRVPYLALRLLAQRGDGNTFPIGTTLMPAEPQ